ncbi:hypothetical protein TorRG33x02_182250 [Trema orientale]|uniref:Uncharacterized protein n=1 Tax=Trema orientale TaxID=63057 RepID=A0A2P5EKG1_TREOI|nr:hypothetical protein TorRG33x02_182250 [Trema orientale]
MASKFEKRETGCRVEGKWVLVRRDGFMAQREGGKREELGYFILGLSRVASVLQIPTGFSFGHIAIMYGL